VGTYIKLLFQIVTMKLRYLSHCGTSLSMPLLKKLAAKPFIESCTTSFVSWSLLRFWLAKSFLRWRNKWSSLYQGGNCMEDAWKFPIWPVQVMRMFRQQCHSYIVITSLNNQHNFLTFPLYTAPLPYISTICLQISTGWKILGFKIRITDHVLGFSIFVFVFNNYSEWGWKLWQQTI